MSATLTRQSLACLDKSSAHSHRLERARSSSPAFSFLLPRSISCSRLLYLAGRWPSRGIESARCPNAAGQRQCEESLYRTVVYLRLVFGAGGRLCGGWLRSWACLAMSMAAHDVLNREGGNSVVEEQYHGALTSTRGAHSPPFICVQCAIRRAVFLAIGAARLNEIDCCPVACPRGFVLDGALRMHYFSLSTALSEATSFCFDDADTPDIYSSWFWGQ
ncbi:hypothetical protein DFH06DRAFT_143764 [Mycena polygramma]|nr:hypothetical protein DFH06DRAFT_143764 [Mycena polygramma]